MFSRTSAKKKDQASSLFTIVAKSISEPSPDDAVNREIVLRTRALDYNLFASILSLVPPDYPIESFENLVDECNELLTEQKDSRNQVRGVYPAQFPNYSNLILTKNYRTQFNQPAPSSSSTPSRNQDEQIFMQLLRNAYANDLDVGSHSNQQNNGLMRCNVILRDISEIHSFEFDTERVYWKFIASIHQGINQENVSFQGKCRYVTGNKSAARGEIGKTEKEPGKKRFSITMGALTNSSAQNNYFNDFYELRGDGIYCKSNSNHETVVLFKDIIALALTLDHRLPVDHILHVGIRLPAGYFRVVKSELKSLDLQFATTNAADKRSIHASEQFDHKSLPFDSLDNHTAMIPLTADILGLKTESSNLSPVPSYSSSSPAPFPTQQNKEVSPLVRSVSYAKCVWEFEVFSDRTNGRLLGKKTLQLNPFLEAVNPKNMDADLRRIVISTNNANPNAIIASSLPPPDSNNNADTSPFSQFSSFGRARGKSVKFSSPPPLNRRDSGAGVGESLSPKQSPKRYTSINFSSNTNSVGGNAVKPILKYADVKKYDLDIVQKQFNKALRVFIKSASGLAGSGAAGAKKASLPSAYCTVYLVGKNQQRLTSNHAEVRTDVVKNFDPEWNKEILLQDQNLGIEEVQSVMVLVRDSASGFLKHKHLGQVMVPIDCFLPQDEAAFCLPLEPSYRMDGKLAEQSFLGFINLTTQLVNVESLDESAVNLEDIYQNAATETPAGPSSTLREDKKRGTANPTAFSNPQPAETTSGTTNSTASSKQRQLFVRTKSVELVNAQLFCTLFRSSPTSTWWPVKILHISNSPRYRSSPSINHHGFLLLNPHAIILKAASSSQSRGEGEGNSMMATEMQSIAMVGELFEKSAEYNEPHVILPYSQVESVTALSSACLLLTIHLHHPSNYNVAGASSASGSFVTTVDVLCGPCKAEEMTQFLGLRRKYEVVCHELNHLQSMVTFASSLQFSPAPSRSLSNDGAGGAKKFIPPEKSESLRFTKGGVTSPSTPPRRPVADETALDRFTSLSTSFGSGEWIASVKTIIKSLENQHRQLMMQSNTAKSDPSVDATKRSDDTSNEEIYLRILFHFLRLFFLPNLISISNDVTINATYYSQEAIKARLRSLMDQSVLQTKGKESGTEVEIDQLDNFFERAFEDIRQCIIFSCRLLGNVPSSALYNQETFLEDYLKPSLEYLLTTIHHLIQEYLQSSASSLFLQSTSTVNSTPPSEAILSKKRKWMKFFVEKNHILNEKMVTILMILHPSIQAINPAFSLLPPATFREFNQSLYRDHLNVLQANISTLFRENPDQSLVSPKAQTITINKGDHRSKYRWTIFENNRGHRVSSIPESVQRSLTTLIEYYDSLNPSELVNSSSTSSSEYVKLCKKVLLIMYNAWLFVGHEYYSATKEYYIHLISTLKASPKLSSADDLLLFLSILNDCSRIVKDYLPILRKMTHKLLTATSNNNIAGTLENDIMKSLQDESYDIIIEQLLHLLARLIFMPVLQSFLHFDEQCFRPTLTTSRTQSTAPSLFITTVCDQLLLYFGQVKAALGDSQLCLALLYLAEEAIINRYLLFIHDSIAASSNNSTVPLQILTRDEAIQFQTDYQHLQHVVEMISTGLPTTLSEEKSNSKAHLTVTTSLEWQGPPMLYFEHLVNLLVASIDSFEFNHSLRFLLTQTEVATASNNSKNSINHLTSVFLEYFLLHIILPLHAESNNEGEYRRQKEELYNYLMNFLDGNYEIVYRRTNDFCPIHIQPRNHHTVYNSQQQQKQEEVLPPTLRRDLLWRMFFPTNQNRPNPTQSSSNTQPRGSVDSFLPLPDSLQHPFKGLFPTASTSSNKAPPNQPLASAENRSARATEKLIPKGVASVENVRQSASEWMQKLNFIHNSTTNFSLSQKKGDATSSSKKGRKENGYDEDALFAAIGLEVTFYSETIVSMEEAQSNSHDHSGSVKQGNAAIGANTSVPTKTNGAAASAGASASFQTPVRTTRQDSSNKNSLFNLFTGGTAAVPTSTSAKNNPSTAGAAVQQKKGNRIDAIMTENKEESSFEPMSSNRHAPTTPSVQQALHFFDDNDVNTTAQEFQERARSNEEKPQTLIISQVRLSGVHTASLFSKPNPYVYFLIPVLQFKTKTSLLHNANHGDFADILRVPLPSKKEWESPSQQLLVEVYDKEKIRRKVLLGWNSLDLANKTNSEEVQTVDLPLISPDIRSASSQTPTKECGRITFRLQFVQSS